MILTSSNNVRNGSCFYVAGYLIEERRRWPVFTASHEDNVINKFRILKERHVQMRKPYQSRGRVKNSFYYIAPVGDSTHDLPDTVASNMVKVATEAVNCNVEVTSRDRAIDGESWREVLVGPQNVTFPKT